MQNNQHLLQHKNQPAERFLHHTDMQKEWDMGADASAEPALLQPRIVVFRALEKTFVLLRGGGDVFTIPGNVVASMAKVMGVCEDSSG
ncbi:unnamed protein product [Sphagnum jensenii]|uniref:Uncharacterized protein n=1 Tax=Sphagnum jensenii TaxID=128206 RepID=A0ABP1AHK3_9BRYO